MSPEERDSDETKPGDAFTQATSKTGAPAPLAGFGEIRDDDQAQLDKYGLDHAGEMMKGVTGLIAEHRAAKQQPLSAVSIVFGQLAAALQSIEKS